MHTFFVIFTNLYFLWTFSTVLNTGALCIFHYSIFATLYREIFSNFRRRRSMHAWADIECEIVSATHPLPKYTPHVIRTHFHLCYIITISIVILS